MPCAGRKGELWMQIKNGTHQRFNINTDTKKNSHIEKESPFPNARWMISLFLCCWYVDCYFARSVIQGQGSKAKEHVCPVLLYFDFSETPHSIVERRLTLHLGDLQGTSRWSLRSWDLHRSLGCIPAISLTLGLLNYKTNVTQNGGKTNESTTSSLLNDMNNSH